MIHNCPNCHHTDLHCHAVIRATLHTHRDQNGSVQYSLLDWDEILEVESYECMNCGHKFREEN